MKKRQEKISAEVRRRNRAVEPVTAIARLRRERRGATFERTKKKVEELKGEKARARRAGIRHIKQIVRKL